jgi:uncharacterized protein YjbJ (UPF0337 family)
MKDKIKGKAEEVKGKLTDDKGEELKGKARQVKGEAEQKIDRIADEAEDRKKNHRDDEEPR